MSMAAETQGTTLHIFFLPFLAPGHMLPMVDTAKLFSEHGAQATIVTTPANAARIKPTITHTSSPTHPPHHHPIQVLEIPFPSEEVGLPPGWENVADFPTPAATPSFFEALHLLRRPFDEALRESRPDCVVSDTLLPWSTDSASEIGVPRLVFSASGEFYAAVCLLLLGRREGRPPQDGDGSFVVRGLPRPVRMKRSQFPAGFFDPNDEDNALVQSILKSHGLLFTGFRELEAPYITPPFGGLKSWHLGPLALRREDTPSSDDHPCLNWLNSKDPGSVLYICFGSLGRFSAQQIQEIATALHASNHPFVWVMKAGRGEEDDHPEWPPELEGVQSKGLVIRGWVPQVRVLNHRAVGGFMTHCGWNSILEGVAAGVPMVTWPLCSDQFVNERLVVDLLRVGAGVGVEKCSDEVEERELVGLEEIKKAVGRVMGVGEEAEGMRKRAEELAVMAREVVEDGGSSHTSMRNLIEELMAIKKNKELM